MDVVTNNYSYDAIYQLVVDQSASAPASQYSYDSLGNRITAGGKTYTSNNLNQYTQVDSTALNYDQNGNLAGDGTWVYAYDYENRLISASKSGTTATYKYDVFGRRVTKDDGGGTITNFIYDGDQIIAEYDGSGNLLGTYIYGTGIDEPISTIRYTPSAERYFYHFDGLGSITELTDSSGAVAEKYEYGAYGKTVIKDASNNTLSQSAIGNRFGFTGRELDSDTGLYYYRARYYSPELGRFLQTDPLGIDDENPYTYCSNDPVNYIDPYGYQGSGIIFTIWNQGLGQILRPPVLDPGLIGTDIGPTPGENAPVNPKRISEGTEKVRTGEKGLSERVASSVKKAEKGGEKEDKQENNWWERFKKLLRKLKGNQGYMDKKGNIYKPDKFHHGDHIDVSDKKGRRLRELDINTGRQIWPGGPKNKNR